MKFEVGERIIVMQLLPAESDYLTYKVITDLKSNLGFSEDEIKKFEIKSIGNQTTWSIEKAKPKEIEVGDKGVELITNGLKELDKKGKISAQSALLYERFVLTEEEK